MKKYTLHIISILAALLVAQSAWGQDRGTLPAPDELNEDLLTGTYTLSKDYKPGSQRRWRVSGGRNVVVDLNGHTIDGADIERTIFNISNGTLTIRDSKGSGKIINSIKSCFYVAPSSGAKSTLNLQGGTIQNCQPSDGNGGAIDIQPNGTVNMSGGTITECRGTNGAAVYVTGGTFNMTGGEIKNNKVNAYKSWTPPAGAEDIPTSSNTTSSRGGGIYVEAGTCTVSGGTISGNVAHSGGGVFVTSGAKFTFTGGTITGNYAVSKLGASNGNGGGIYIEGGNSNCTINGGTISNNRATRYGGGININGSTMTIPNCTISGNIASSGGGISMETAGSTLNLQGCTLDRNIAKVSGSDPNGANGGGGGIFVVNGTINMSSTNKIQKNRSRVLGGGIYVKAGNIKATGTSTFTGNEATNTDGVESHGGAIYIAGGNIAVDASGTFNIGGNDTSTGNHAKNNGGGIYCKGTITINGSSNMRYNTAYDGGAVFVTGGNVILASNTISYNSATHYGGALYVTEGNLEMQGTSTMQDNTAILRGGAAYVNKGKILTAAGNLETKVLSNTVIGNESSTKASGGAFYIEGETSSKGQLDLRGITTMNGNSTKDNGGAVTLKNGDLVITGSKTTFSGNHSENGGAVYVSSGDIKTNNASTVTVLENNYCKEYGGAVFVTGGNFNTQGSISVNNNYAQNDGGAIYVTGGTVTMAAPTITGNGKKSGIIETSKGGAIFVTGTGASFTATGNCTISSNAAKTDGGAVYVNGGSISITGISSTLALSDNNAENGGAFYVDGGNIYADEISNAAIKGNNSTLDGGAFYVNNGNIKLCETEISGNAANRNGGAIALYNGTFEFADGSEIKNNTATGNGGGLYISNASSTNITCVGGSYEENNANFGGGIYASGPINLTFAANVENNMATNGGGLYLDGGVNMTFGYIDDNSTPSNTSDDVEIAGLIVRNEANGTGSDGVGGGIYLANGTLSFAATENLGIYNNAASYEAADIFVSGCETTINLPYVKGLNLSGFDVPGSELYWVNDFHDGLGRYEIALRNAKADIEAMIHGFTTQEQAAKVKVISNVKTCLDLGYDLVFVTFTPVNLADGDNAVIEIYYPDDRQYSENGEDIIAVSNPVMYRELLLTGSDPQIIGLPSGYWYFDTTRLTYAYADSPVFSPASGDDFTSTLSDSNDATKEFVEIKRNQDQDIKLTFSPKTTPEFKALVKYSTMYVNKMYPGGSSTH